MGEMEVSQMSIVGTEHPHGGDGDAVLEGKSSDLKRGEEGRVDFVIDKWRPGRGFHMIV
jgi:hypothetical protein